MFKTVASTIAVFFVIWWTVLFAVLPFGVKSQADEGEVVRGSEPGAPAAPMLMKKAGITTAIAVVVYVIVWFLYGLIDV
jgi:predicted secreted protein